MDSHNISPEIAKPGILKLAAWVLWVGFLLFSFGLFLVAEFSNNGIFTFFHLHGGKPLNRITVLVISHTVWIAILPFLWLPFVISFQRKTNPRIDIFLLLSATIVSVILVVTVATLLACALPWIPYYEL